MNRVNVIIAHKDYNDDLVKAIESCKNQTIPVNYTVVDDGSNTPPDAPDWPQINFDNYKVFCLDGNRFIYLKENLGPSHARNIGITEAWDDSDYFQILDADDLMLPNKCERLLAEFDENTGIVYGDYYIKSDDILKMEFKIPYTRLEFEQHCIVHSGSMISKKFLAQVNENGFFYDPLLRVAEDYDLFLRISELSMVKHVPEFLTIVREHEFNSTNTVQQEIWQQCLQRVHQKRMLRNARR